VIRATNSDDHVNRTYTRHAGTEKVGVFIAYGIRARDLIPHRPEVCYPGAGWNLKETQVVNLSWEGEKTPLSAKIYTFDHGGLDSRMVYVLNYYIVDGIYYPDVSLLRSRAWQGSEGIHYMAQIQISCSGDSVFPLDMSEIPIRAFAIDSAKAIFNLFPKAEKQK
jgi:hypothetical protein